MAEATFPEVAMTRAAAATDVAIAVGVIVVSSTLPPIVRGLVGFGGSESWYLWAVVGGVVVLAAVSLLLRRRGQTPADIGLGPAPAGRVVRATLVGVPLSYLAGVASVALLAGFSPEGLTGLAREKTEFLHLVATIPRILVLPVSLFVGLYEEVLFRGFLLTRFRVLTGGSVGPVVLTATLFGALHFPQGLVGVVQTAAVGMVLAALAVRTRTLWSAILVHATIDTVSLTITGLLADRLALD